MSGNGKPKRNTSNLVPFKPGHDPRRNLKGRPVRFTTLLNHGGDGSRITYDDVRAVVETQLMMEEADLKAIVMNPKAMAFEQIIAHAILKDIARGTLMNVEILMSRLYGRPKEYLNVDQNISQTKVYHLPMPDYDEPDLPPQSVNGGNGAPK